MQLLMSLLERFDILLQAISFSILQVVLPHIMCHSCHEASFMSITHISNLFHCHPVWLELLLLLPAFTSCMFADLESLHGFCFHCTGMYTSRIVRSISLPWAPVFLGCWNLRGPTTLKMAMFKDYNNCFIVHEFCGSNAAHLNKTAVPRLQAVMPTETLQNRFYIFENAGKCMKLQNHILAKVFVHVCSRPNVGTLWRHRLL